MRFPFIFLVLLGWPLLEIAGYVIVGHLIGLWLTLGLVIATGIAGALLIRSQGLHLLRQISSESRQGGLPARELVDGAMIVVAGIMLLLPGFLTDLVGLLLLVPFVRQWIWSAIGRKIVVVGPSMSGSKRPGSSSAPGGSPFGTPPSGSGRGTGTGPAASSGGRPENGPVVDLGEDDYRRDDHTPSAGPHSATAGKPLSPWSKNDAEDR